MHLSSHQGQSLEFSDLKGYAFGDDPRGIDWKVFARTDKLYVRRYLDETNLTAHLLLDASGSMAYPVGASKFQYAASMLRASDTCCCARVTKSGWWWRTNDGLRSVRPAGFLPTLEN